MKADFINTLFTVIMLLCAVSPILAGEDTALSGDGGMPEIDPDYRDVVIPPNIAPLNFIIGESGVLYKTEISGESGSPIRIRTRHSKVCIPVEPWKSLLEANKGKTLTFQIAVKDSAGQWQSFEPIMNRIAPDPIDSYVAYRLINPGYVLWWNMGIYQRNIETYEESAIMTNRVTKNNCMNCHAFCQQNPDPMMFHMRASFGGTIFIQEDNITKVNTKTEKTMSAGVYPSWHPDGGHIAFSVNKVYQSFHSAGAKSIHVWDKASDLIVYDVRSRTVTTNPAVSTPRMENLPAWSADGQMIYYISGDAWDNEKAYDDYQYDLMRIPYDIAGSIWGEAEVLISASESGRSVTFPRPSPDGRWLLFTMSDYGYFSIHFRSSDLYLFDLETMDYHPLALVNSPHSDSYHSWSSNSRWFVFASKRRDGLCSRLYFSYVDKDGNACKPVLLPQKDPAFYHTFIKNYNVPEMIRGPVSVNRADLIRKARQDAEAAGFDPDVDFDALSGATYEPEEAEPLSDLEHTAQPYGADGR